MNNQNAEKWTLEDGRKVEKRTNETVDSVNLTSEKVVELHMEDERPLKLKQRVVEKSKPFVFERKVETIDANGNVVDVKVESSEPKVQMQFVEHIAVNSGVAAHGVCKKVCHPKGVTKEELAEAIALAINASKDNNDLKINSLGLADQIAEKINSEGSGITTKVLIGLIVALTIGLGYLLFVA